MIGPDPFVKIEFMKPLDIEPRFLLQAHIRYGEIICEKIKSAYFSQEEWRICYRKVSKMFTVIKNKMREFDTSLTENEFIRTLSEYPMEDLKEIYGLLPADSSEKPVVQENKTPGDRLW